MTEKGWRDIDGFEGLYMINGLGNIKSLIKHKILKPQLSSNKYLHVSLYKNSKVKIRRIHRLVAKAFLDNPLNLKEINHKDLDKSNNCVLNLEWSTRCYNNLHKNLGTKRGVDWYSSYNKWRSTIKNKGKTIFLGYFNDKEKAYQAFYDRFVEIHGIEPW